MKYLLRDVPEDLRAELAGEARHRLTSLSSHIAGILAARYSLDYEPPIPRGLPQANGATFQVEVPGDVMYALRKEADKRKVPVRSVILRACAEHFGMEPPPERKMNPKRRPGAPRTYKHGRPKGRKAKQ